MKELKIASILLGIFLFLSCSKDNEEVAPITTKYLERFDYIQTFYYRKAEIVNPPNNVKVGILTSRCKRIHYTIYDYEENFNSINPPQELIDKVESLNGNSQDKNSQYYLVANIKFCYYDEYTIKDVSLKSNWEIAIGRIGTYSFNGNTHKCLIISGWL